MGGHIFGQHRGVGVGVVAADDDDGGQAVLLRHFGNDPELFLSLQLRTAGTDDIETAGIPVLVDVFVGELDEIVVDQSGGTALEAKEYVALVRSLERVVQTADHVMSAGRLSAGKDHAHDLFLRSGGVAALDEGHFVLAVGVGEQSLDLLLVGHALRGFAGLNADLGDAAAQHAGKLGAVSISCLLKR